jgi:hypothetical protein
VKEQCKKSYPDLLQSRAYILETTAAEDMHTFIKNICNREIKK